MNRPLILIVEDDRQIRSFLGISLAAQNYGCLEAANGQTALSLAASHNPDVLLLDLGLPDMDGLAVIRQLRQWSQAAVIVVSARGQDREKAEALDAGADDYLTKPFSVTELLARVRVAVRHLSQRNGDTPPIQGYTVGELTVDFDKRRVLLGGEEIHMTPNEFGILSLMARNAGKVMTHNMILREIWGPYSGTDTQSLRVFMASLRRKIEKNAAQPRYIITEVGIGYRLADE